MGQQQLLLVILVTIIVGIATVVAINTFSSAQEGANLDAVRQDVANIAAASQAYYMKPEMLGGGGNDFGGLTFNNVNFAADSVSSNGLTAINQNGVYVINGGSAIADGTTNFSVTAHPSSRISGAMDLSSTATEGEGSLEADVLQDDMTWTDNQ